MHSTMLDLRTRVGQRGHPVKNSRTFVSIGILSGNLYGVLKGVTEENVTRALSKLWL